MFHYFDTITNTRGDSLVGWQVECVQLADGATVVPIFADENSTPILSVSGAANRAVTDENGNYDFFVPSGVYSLRIYNAQGIFQRLQRYLPMYGQDATSLPNGTASVPSIRAAADQNTGIYFPADDAVALVSGGVERLRASTAGNILVATTTGSALSTLNGLVVNGENGSITIRRTTGSNQGHIGFVNNGNTVGTISTSTTATTYATSSDARLKENIADADDAGALVEALQVRQFDWRVNGEHQGFGFIAQELIGVVPEAVSVPEDEAAMMAVDYSKLVPMLVKEVQSLRVRVAAIEAGAA